MESKVLSLLLLFTSICRVSAAVDFWRGPGDAGTDSTVSALVSSMSDNELLGQVMMLGYPGVKPPDQFLSWIKDRGIGGVAIFGWNSVSLMEMAAGIGEMQKTAESTRLKIPLLVATDEEGGWVRHVKGDTSVTPGNLAIGATGDAIDAYRTGLVLATELKILGINMNLAPDVDVYSNPNNDVIGPRSFSRDAVEVALLAVAFYKGEEKAGIIATAKHFPGHGDTDKDSHGTMPVIKDPLSVLWNRDLLPYRFLIPEGLPAIMTGHLNFPLITHNDDPATVSPFFETDLLRNRLGFHGLTITDDMIMYGVLQNGRTTPVACKEALLAGNDMVMISGPPRIQEQTWNYLLEQMKEDPALHAAIVKAVRHVLAVKFRYLYTAGKDSLIPDLSKVATELPDKSGKSYFFDLACRSTTLIRSHLIPLPEKKSVNVLLAGQYSEFLSEGLARFPDAKTVLFSYDSPSRRQLTDIVRLASKADTVILCLADNGSLKVLKALEPYKDKLIVFSVLTPMLLRTTPWIESAVAVYGTGIDSFAAGFAVIKGDFVPEGKLPVQIFPKGN